jgi:Carboxypeptidase regulatory-like domain
MAPSAFAVATLIACSALAQGPVKSDGAKSDCTIDGSIVNAVTGQPVARATVRMIDTRSNVTGVTNTSGKWGFSNVDCVEVQLRFERPGFIQRTRIGAPTSGLEIRLTPYSVITGKVVDDQGEPVRNTQVRAHASTVIDGVRTLQPPVSTTTNDLGEFRLPVAPGKYIVCARAEGALPLPSGAATLYADRCTPDLLQITSGGDTRIDFALVQVPAVHVRGIVSGLPEGTGVGVILTPAGADQSAGADRAATARPSGAFDFSRVAPGSYVMHASLSRDRHLMARLPIEVGQADVDGVSLQLEPAVNFTGAIHLESKAEFPWRQPVRLVLRSSAQLNPTRIVESNDALKFALADVAPGVYRLSLQSVPSPFYVKSVTIAGRDVLDREFTLSQASEPVEIILRDDGGSIEGDIDAPAAQIVAMQDGRASIGRAAGHFTLQNLAPGDYVVYAFDGPYAEYADPEWMKRYAGVKVTVASGQTAQAKLTVQKIPQ